MMHLPQKIVEIVESVIGKGPHKLHEPLIGESSRQWVEAVFRSNHFSAGEVTERFERALAKFVGTKYCVATCSGTAALHAAYTVMFAGVQNEIHIPSLTFVATANALAQLGHKIRFVDYGEPCDVPVDILGHEYKQRGMLHDASQALGSLRTDARYIGATGTAVFSFNQNKTLTTGGGGAIVTDDVDLYTTLKHITTTARIPDRWRVAHDAIAFNYRMPDINAAVGLGQLDDLPAILKAKRALALQYIKAFDGVAGVSIWQEPEGTVSNCWLVALRVESHDDQQMALWGLHNRGIQARMLPTPLHHLEMYKGCPTSRSMALTDELFDQVICLPSSPKLGLQYVE